ncbi:MAG: lysophospholipid acyltransferase family protein [Deltaproteobacteria bacterium]|nr:lysophospholipid acyltransferase family protein [Deltaproteobacteria bacterium]
MKKLLDYLAIHAAPRLAYWIIRFISITMRKTYVNFEAYRAMLERGEKIILAFWHGRLLMMPYSYPGKGITILVSQSKDGELISRTVKNFGIESVRGSSTRGWISGVKGLLRSVQAGRDVAITPDGPKGPKEKAQMGAVQIARTTGLPIIPVSFNASKKKTFRSWDSFILPYPFSKGVFICGEPILVDAKSGPEEMEASRVKLEETLNKLTREADGYFA